ncbi:MAG: Ca2+-dependent phosphoinositide-specific phospholipase C, partial [Planctomycetota bacterium]
MGFIPDVAPTLDYSHIPLTEQFASQGIRQIELDLFYDPEGGLYANRQALTFFGEDPASGVPALSEPGLKVLHVQEIDYETSCFTFVA